MATAEHIDVQDDAPAAAPSSPRGRLVVVRDADNEKAAARAAWTAEGQTDVANAERFAAMHSLNVRYCDADRKFYVWDGARFRVDETREIDIKARETAATLWQDVATVSQDTDEGAKNRIAAAIKWAKASNNDKGLAAMLKQARSIAPIGIRRDEFDRPKMLFNVVNGTLDLETGKLRAPQREDLLTKLCPYPFDPNAKAPTWESCLAQTFSGDDSLIGYFQRLCGYWLTAEIREQILAIFHGAGANGKTTIINAIMRMMGDDYCLKADKSLLLAKKHEGHSTERMDLHGKRLAVATETENGQRLAESLAKDLTGKEQIRGRRMRQDSWQYEPVHKILLVTNHLPQISGRDHAIWRRIKVVPFFAKFQGAADDPRFDKKLEPELPGILAWAVRGCLLWQRDGLGEPPVVNVASSQYRADEDTVGRFIDEHCYRHADARGKLSVFRERYVDWCEDRGDEPITGRAFGETLLEMGFERYTNNGTWYRGIGLLKPAK